MTRRDFINGGIAAITYNSLFATPIRSAIGARSLFSEDNGEDGFPYVTDGLLAMWDAEWNVGIGEHESTPMVWKNLVDNGLDMISNGNPVFYDNYIQPTQQSEMWHTDVTDLCDEMLSNATLTMEVVAGCVIGKTQPKFCLFGGGGLGQCSFASAACPDATRVGIDFRIGNSAAAIYGTHNPFGYFSVSSNGMSATGYYKSSSGELERTVAVSAPITNFVSKRFAIGYRYPYYWDSPMINGEKVYSIRVYDRALSPNEISFNYSIDQARFGL